MAVSRSLLTGAGIALTALDAVGTVAAIQFLGASEVNPLLSDAIGAVGLHTAVLVRLSLGVMVLLLLDTLTTHVPDPRAGVAALGAAVLALAVVNVSNGLQIGEQVLAASR